MQTIPSNYSETYALIEQARDEAKEIAIQAIRDHIERMRAPGTCSQPDHPHHKGYIAALEFAVTLVRFS